MIFLEGSGACIIFYDLIDRTSFESLNDCIDEFGSVVETEVPLTIIGTKLDKIRQDPAQRQVTFAEGQKFVQSVNPFFYEISVKTDGSTITQIIKELIQAYWRSGSKRKIITNETIDKIDEQNKEEDPAEPSDNYE